MHIDELMGLIGSELQTKNSPLTRMPGSFSSWVRMARFTRRPGSAAGCFSGLLGLLLGLPETFLVPESMCRHGRRGALTDVNVGKPCCAVQQGRCNDQEHDEFHCCIVRRWSFGGYERVCNAISHLCRLSGPE